MEIVKDGDKNESEKLSLTVKSSARKEILEVWSNSTIYNFKEIIADKFNVDAHSLRLIYAGRILKDTDTLTSLNIKNGYTIYAVVKSPLQSNSNLSNDALPSNPNISSTVSRNMLQHYANTPDILRSIINNNPAIQQMVERNPEIGHVFNNPTLLREAMQVIRNPNVADEFVRSADRAMNNIESLPGGFNALQQMYRNIEEPLISATNDSDNPFVNLFTSTETSNQQETEIREPLPNPWSPNVPVTSEVNNELLFDNPLIQNMVEQLQNHLPQIGNNTSFQSPQDLQDLFSSMTQSEEYANLQQVRDILHPTLLQNANALSENSNFSPEVINTIILPALLLASIVRNQPPDLTNNNDTNFNAVSHLLSHLNLQSLPNRPTDIEEHYRTQMQQLIEMGFVNQEANLQALVASFGDLNRAIEMLLSRNLMN